MAASSVRIRTSHGDIEVDRISGRTDISNSHGDIEVAFSQLDNAYLRTSHGDVYISAPRSTAADLDLKADRVRIADTYRFEGELKKDRADGHINGGGPRVEARASHGSITLRDN